MQYLSEPTATSTFTFATPFGTGKPPIPAGLTTLRRPALSLATFGTPVVSTYLYNVPEPFADQFAHGMVRVALFTPSLSVTDAPEPLPPAATQRGSDELPVAPGITKASFDRSTILGVLLSSSFFPVMP
jgi:hypothetical protein